MFDNRIYTARELMEQQIYTNDYQFMDKPCTVVGILVLKADSRKPGILRVFFQLDDGRKIITPVFWWQQYLGFFEIEIGKRLRLTYRPGGGGEVYLFSAVEIID